MHNYAAVESGIKIAVSGILEVRLGHAMIAFEPYGSLDLKNVAKSLAKERLKPHVAERFCWLIGEWTKHSWLRNSIAHNRWTAGTRPDSIKPQTVKIREGRADWIGSSPAEADFTPEEIEAKADELHHVNEGVKDFLQTSGLQAIIEAKMEDTSN